jgi:hypothetical protein
MLNSSFPNDPAGGTRTKFGKRAWRKRIAMGISDMAGMGQEKGLVRRLVRCVIKKVLPFGR